MTRRLHRASVVGQSLSWFFAAVIVLVGSGLIAFWLSNTARNVDRDTLDRGADAIVANIDNQVRLLALAGTGTKSLVGQPLEDVNLSELTRGIDISVLKSLMAVVAYPVTANGVGTGSFIDLQLLPIEFEVPDFEISRAELDAVLDTDTAVLSQPIVTTDPERLDYVVALPLHTDRGYELIGVVFRLDKLLEPAMEGAGGDQYAVEVVDPRYDDQVVARVGTLVGNLEAPRVPPQLSGQLEVIVHPGSDFVFANSRWIPGLVVGAGVAVALLLVGMARMAKTGSEELSNRLRLAQELNESKDRFLAAVSHELRTPLTVVLGVAWELGPHWRDLTDSDRDDLLLMLGDQASEAANIVEDLLVAARTDPSQLRMAVEETDILSHVEYAVGSLPTGNDHRVSYSDLDEWVLADTTRLRQVLRNLLENAVRYGGPNITVSSASVGDRVEISVCDDGENFSAGDIDRIFEPYEQSHLDPAAPAGVGIGLFVSRLLAHLMHGELDCVRGEGITTFRLTLPAAERSTRVAPESVSR